MRCDKEWKGGDGGGGDERATGFHLDRVRAIVGKGFDRRLTPLCGSLAFHVVFRLIRN